MSARPGTQDAEHRAGSDADWLLIRTLRLPVAACSSAKRAATEQKRRLQERCIAGQGDQSQCMSWVSGVKGGEVAQPSMLTSRLLCSSQASAISLLLLNRGRDGTAGVECC